MITASRDGWFSRRRCTRRPSLDREHRWRMKECRPMKVDMRMVRTHAQTRARRGYVLLMGSFQMHYDWRQSSRPPASKHSQPRELRLYKKRGLRSPEPSSPRKGKKLLEGPKTRADTTEGRRAFIIYTGTSGQEGIMDVNDMPRRSRAPAKGRSERVPGDPDSGSGTSRWGGGQREGLP